MKCPQGIYIYVNGNNNNNNNNNKTYREENFPFLSSKPE